MCKNSKNIIQSTFFVLILFSFFACDNTHQEPAKSNFLSISGQKFIDPHGREVILSGINFISKNPGEKYLPPQGPELFEQFGSWGINCIRLGIIWDGLEPEPGVYNEAYLNEIDKRIQWAADNNIYVFLDMHQDLFSVKYADGAPVWATLDEGQPHYKGAVWSDSYLISPAVQTAFDNFWKNTPAADGIGIQDHYANLWKHIAQRYANNTTVIGYDIMNEPFMGTPAREVMPTMLEAYATVFALETGKAPPSAQEMENMWAAESSRMEALNFIATRDRYSKVVDAVYELNAAFEKNQLQSMYQKVANAIREVDKNHILFLNHSYFANTGVASAIEATTLANGTVDTLVAYAAHGYDLVVDTKEVDNPSYDRVEFIFERINETGERLDMPVMLGEWGALHGRSEKMTETAQHLVNTIEGYNFSNTYWCYYPGISNDPYFFSAIVRPYPQFISGSLLSANYNYTTGEFTCVWNETNKSTEPTVIYVPDISGLTSKDVMVEPGAEQMIFEHDDHTNAGRLLIAPLGNEGTRRLSFRVMPEQESEIDIQQNQEK